jgi:hypothetical protein
LDTSSSKYPQHERLKAIQPLSQACGEFLEFLSEKEILLGEYVFSNDRLIPVRTSTEKLLAEFFEIDLKVLEQEKEHMLEQIRKE